MFTPVDALTGVNPFAVVPSVATRLDDDEDLSTSDGSSVIDLTNSPPHITATRKKHHSGSTSRLPLSSSSSDSVVVLDSDSSESDSLPDADQLWHHIPSLKAHCKPAMSKAKEAPSSDTQNLLMKQQHFKHEKSRASSSDTLGGCSD